MKIELNDFVAALVSNHGSRLKSFSVHNMPISLEVLDKVCTGFMKLEDLTIIVDQKDLVGNFLEICSL